jgi:transposase-like protein
VHPIEHFFCPSPDCPDHGRRGGGNLYFRGYSGRSRAIRMVFCRTCKAHFSERKGTALEGCRLAPDKAISVLQHLQEGCGTRATGRLVGVHRDTVTRLARFAGSHARGAHDELVAFSPPQP